MKQPIVRHAFNFNPDENSFSSGIHCDQSTKEGRSLAKQSEKDDADINVLMQRFGVTGSLNDLAFSTRNPTFGDFTGIGDYHTLMNTVKTAQNAFYELPSGIRNRFNNNPDELVKFMNNPSNRSEAENLGLVNKKLPVEPSNGETVGTVPIT